MRIDAVRAANRWSRYALIVFLAALATWLLVQILHKRSIYFELRMQVKVNRASVAHLFYDSGHGFNGLESESHSIPASGNFEPVIFRIEGRELHGLRFDPCADQCVTTIGKVELVSKTKRLSVSPQQFRAANEIESLHETGAELTVTTPVRALNPQLLLDLGFPITETGELNVAEKAPLLLALFATLTALCIVEGRGGIGPVIAGGRNVWLFPAVCSVVALAMSSAGFNGSSSAELFSAVDNVPSSRGLILGEAKFIRSDEWAVYTPWLLSQAKQIHPFSSHNPSVGGKHSPLVCSNLPVAHWTMCFRPELWPFFTGLTVESAFAFFWNFKWWSLLCGSYVLLLVVTRGESFLSAAGALMLLWTSTVQWWFSSLMLMPDMVGLWCFALAAGFGAVVHQKRWWRVLLSAAYAFCALGFLLCCYPPFQIPLLTLFAPLLFALVHDRKTLRHWTAFAAATGLVAVGASVFAWQLRDTLSAMSALIYPGQRFSTGGGVPWTTIVHGFLTLGIAQLHYPKNFDNVVAASSFLNALPLLACVHLARWRRSQRHDAVQSVLLAFAALTVLFAVCGIPRWLAKVSLWSYVTTERLSVPLAVVSVLAICRFLAPRVTSGNMRIGRWYVLVGAFGFGVVLIAANRELHNFVPPAALAAVWLFYSVAGVLLVAKFRLACVAMILFPVVFLNGAINPLGRGIPAYQATSVSPVMAELRKTFPRAHWIVMGMSVRAGSVSALFKAAGATVLSGVTMVPNQEMLDGLDPKHENAFVYSRAAHVCFLPGAESAAAPVFELNQTTVYTVRLPLTDRWLRLAGIDGMVILDAPDMAVPQHYLEVASVSGCRFWIRESARQADLAGQPEITGRAAPDR
jgi:hypothetical protein